jgi:tRNA(fMet)-specific endonuclease VapC
MVILDTDLITLLAWSDHPMAEALASRLKAVPAAELATTIISYEEQTRGWLGAIKNAKEVKERVEKYRRLRRGLEFFCLIHVLEFDERAAIEFQHLKKSKVRVGTMDLKIGSIALAHQATVLTRNLRDYQLIPGLKVEDWTRE